MRGVSWWFWLIIAFVIGFVEVTTFTFVLLWIAIAAFLTAVLTVFVDNLWIQSLVFAIVSVVLLAVTRPVVRKWKQKRTYPDRLDTMIGHRGVVVTEALPGAFATVRVKGDLWSARSAHPLQEGQEILVVSASATILTVEPVEEG